MFWTRNRTLKLRLYHIANHLLSAWAIYTYGPQWIPISLLIWLFIGSFGISIGFHRLLSHRSFSASPRMTNILATIGCLATGGSPLGWAGAHRLHHAAKTPEEDPHAWERLGKVRVYCHAWKQVVIPRRLIQDLLSVPYLRWLHRNYFLFLFVWAAGLYLIHPSVGAFGYSLPAVFAFHGFGLINLFGHLHGYRNFETNDSSTNSWVANLLTCGEGWHNNHHRFPSLYRVGLGRFEFDISAWLIEHLPIARHREALLKKAEAARKHLPSHPVKPVEYHVS